MFRQQYFEDPYDTTRCNPILMRMCENFTQGSPSTRVLCDHGYVDLYIPCSKGDLKVRACLSSDQRVITLFTAANKFRRLASEPYSDSTFFVQLHHKQKCYFGLVKDSSMEVRVRASDEAKQIALLAALVENWCRC